MNTVVHADRVFKETCQVISIKYCMKICLVFQVNVAYEQLCLLSCLVFAVTYWPV